MAHIPYHPAEAARMPILRRALRAIARAVVANFRARAARRMERRQVSRMHRLDARMLNDIGLSRIDLDNALRDPDSPDESLRRATLVNRKAELERPRLRAR